MTKTQINNKNLFFILFLLLSLLFLVASCGDSNINSPNTSNNTSISVKAADNVSGNPIDTIIITEAKALVREVEYEMEETGTEYEIEHSPFVIYFDINGIIKTVAAGKVPPGNYTKIKFKIHKPEENETLPDPDFKEGTSGNLRYSFIIKGFFNGIPFVYKSKKTAELVIIFNSQINFQTNITNITLLFNMKKWFKNGNVYIDPRESQFEELIDENIKNSFEKAFKDDDINGIPDDH